MVSRSFIWIIGFSLLLGSFGAEFLRADVTLSAIFSDHMVLQQGATLPVWGRADPGERVFVEIASQAGETIADGTGKWRVTLRPLPSSATPLILVVRGKNRLEIKDVLLGDVWICAGEGNMEFSLSDAVGGKDVPEKLADQSLRFFISEKQADGRPQFQGAGSWIVCTSETAPTFSAVGYFFARDLRSTQHLPIGMIQCAWGETPVQAWISRGGLAAKPAFITSVAARSAQSSSPDSNLPEQQPSALFNGMIAPLVPYALAGVIWYQGESQEGFASWDYRRLFPRLIRDWRKGWGEGPFPFFFVQLAGFGDKDGPVVEPFYGEDGTPRRGWPWIREGAACALTLPNTGMVVTTDLGVVDDRLPPDKLDVGRRLALLARKRLYGEDLVDSGPSYRKMHLEGGKIRVEFDSVGNGLTLGSSPFQSDDSVAGTGTILKGFALAGTDGKWFPATATIDGTSVLVSSDAVPYPAAVRYNWKGFPNGNLYNKEGLPAPPFRSDADQPE